MGSIVHIHITPEGGEPMRELNSVKALEGKGLENDRYENNSGTYTNPSKVSEVTFIEEEAILAAARDYDIFLTAGESRRNITTRDIALNHLVGKKFQIGTAVFEGIRLCEPCGFLEKITNKPGVKEALKHRGGLRAKILETGEISVGDSIQLLSLAE